MATISWIVLGIITAIFGVVIGIELKLESDNWYYNCYNNMAYRYKAENFMCQGKENNTKCKSCPYYKKYKKRHKEV